MFSDGSLSDSDRSALEKISSNIEFTDKAQVEQNTLDRLSDYPNCLKLLRHYPQIKKLFQVPINSPEERLVFFDVDVLLMRPSNLNVLWEETDTSIFMQDCIRHAYFMSQTTLFFSRFRKGRKIHDRLNSGIIGTNPERYDYALIEELIKEFEGPIFQSKIWIEQSLQSMHAYGKNTKYVNPAQLFVPELNWTPSNGSLPCALHFTSAMNPLRKAQIEQVIQMPQTSSTEHSTTWNLVEAKGYPYFENFLRERVYRKGRNLFN